jgi:hypothetical protein
MKACNYTVTIDSVDIAEPGEFVEPFYIEGMPTGKLDLWNCGLSASNALLAGLETLLPTQTATSVTTAKN